MMYFYDCCHVIDGKVVSIASLCLDDYNRVLSKLQELDFSLARVGDVVVEDEVRYRVSHINYDFNLDARSMTADLDRIVDDND